MNLEVKNLKFSYGHHEIVKDISFYAETGELVAVLGVNGVGKSTMIKCINKIHKPDSGEILIKGTDISAMGSNELARNIGYVPQSSEFADGTVFDSVLLGRKPFIKWDVTEKDLEIVHEILHLLSLQKYAMRNVTELSGGERQKVAIARALAQQTPVLLFDEPTSNLDLKNQLEVLKIIKNIVKDKVLSAVVVIHDLNLALRFADKFLIIREGRVYDFGGDEIVNERSISEVYGVSASVIVHDGCRIVVPQ